MPKAHAEVAPGRHQSATLGIEEVPYLSQKKPWAWRQRATLGKQKGPAPALRQPQAQGSLRLMADPF